jgi:hypothetical protein
MASRALEQGKYCNYTHTVVDLDFWDPATTGAYLRKIVSPGIHVYMYYMVFAKLLQEI